MTEQKTIQVNQEQALTIREYDAELFLTELKLQRLQQNRYQYLVQQGLIDQRSSDESQSVGCLSAEEVQESKGQVIEDDQA